MATSLEGLWMDDTYKDLLMVSNSNSGIDATLRTVSDVEGTDSLLQLSTTQICINDTPGNHATAPSLCFGDANTGFYESADNQLSISCSAEKCWTFTFSSFFSSTVGSISILRSAATDTSPAYAFLTDTDTGVGRAGADQLSLIAGGLEGIRVHEDTSCWIVQRTPATAAADATLIASSTSFYLDESSSNLMVKVKYADGSTVKSGTVCAVA